MLDGNRLREIYDALRTGGYRDDYKTFVDGFTKQDNYAKRKQVYDLLTAHGAQIGDTYEDFMKRMQKQGGSSTSASNGPYGNSFGQLQMPDLSKAASWKESPAREWTQRQLGTFDQTKDLERDVKKAAKKAQEPTKEQAREFFQQMEDAVDYRQMTGKKLSDFGKDAPGSDFFTPTLKRNADGGVVMGDNGEPLVGFSTDEARKGASNYLGEKVAEREAQEKYEEENAPKPIKGFGEAFKQGTKMMWEGLKNIGAETVNIVTGSNQEYLDAIKHLDLASEYNKSDKYNEYKDSFIRSDEWKNFRDNYIDDDSLLSNLNPIKHNPLIKYGLRALAAHLENKALHEALEHNNYSISAARKELEEKARANESWGDRVKRDVSEAMEKQRPTEGFGAWVGNIAPQMVPSAIAMAASVATKNPAYLKVIAATNLGTMAASTAGLSMSEARKHGASDLQAWGVGLLDGAIEMWTEKIPLDRYTKRLLGFNSKAVREAATEALTNPNSPAKQELQRLLQQARKKLGGKLFTGKNAKEFAGDILAEGLSEFTAEALETITPMIYQNPEEYPTLAEIFMNGLEGAKAGVFMGSVLGSASKGLQYAQNKQRIKQQGYIDVAQVQNSEDPLDASIVEILGRDKDGVIVVRDGDEVRTVNNSDIQMSHRFTYDEFRKAKMEYDADSDEALTDAIDDNTAAGYNAADEQAAVDFGAEYNAAREKAGGVFSDDTLELLDNDPVYALAQMRRDGQYTDDELSAAVEYVNAKAARDGAMQRMEDDLDSAVEAARGEVSQRMNGDDFMIHRAQLKAENEDGTPKCVYITGGNVALREDGSIDVGGSDQTIVVSDAKTGKIEMISPSKIQSVDEAIDPQEEYAQAEAEARAAYEQKKARVLEGRTEEPDVPGETDVPGENLQTETPQAEIKGKEEQAENQQIEEEQGNPPQIKPQAEGENLQTETQTGAEQAAAESPIVQQEEIPVEKDKKGNVVRTLYHKVPMQRTLEDLYDGSLDQEEIDKFVENLAADAKRRLASVENEKKPQIGSNKRAYLEAKRRYEEKLVDARAEVEYYDNLQKEVLRVTQRGGQQTGVSEDLGGEPLSLEELAARFASEYKVTPESLKGETGMSGKELKGFVGLVAKEENGGVSIERLGELLARSDEWAQLGGTPEMTQEARNMLIDAYMSGNPRSYVKQQRERFAQREAEHEMNEIENFAQAAFGMSAEEYLAYEEQALPAIINKYTGFDFDIYYAILQEQADARANEAEANYNNSINGNTNEQQGESNGNGGSGGILQTEGTADEQGERTSDEQEAGGQGGVGNAGLQGVGTQGNVGEGERANTDDRRGGNGSLAGREQGGLAQEEEINYKLSDEVDENGRQFVLNSDGEIEFGRIGGDTGLTPAPILLSEGIITNQKTNAGYGLLHIEARHGKQIRAAGYGSVLEFIEEVAKNYEVIRKGNDRDGRKTYMLQLTDKHNNTLIVELSGDGTYWNINTAGIFKTSYGANRDVVYDRHTTDNQPAETDGASLSGEQSGTTPSTSMNAPAQSYKNGALDNTTDTGKTHKGNGNDTATPENTVVSAGKVTEKENSVQTSIANAEQETDTDPSEAQKKAGNYKKGHVKIDGFDVTIENPKGSMRRGTDADGKQWEQEMHNTYGYILGTEGVDGDHIDVFLSDDPSQGDVFVVDQVNKDGTFDEHKVMYGFADEESARRAYLANYEEGWQGLGAITHVSKEEFKKWVDSSHRKTKPFAEYKGVKKADAPGKTEVQGNTDNPGANEKTKKPEKKKAANSVRSAFDSLKKQVPDRLLIFKTGDSYEILYEDAKKASEILGLSVQEKDGKEFISFPIEDIDKNLPLLVRSGVMAAITDELINTKNQKAEKTDVPGETDNPGGDTGKKKGQKENAEVSQEGEQASDQVSDQVGGKEAKPTYQKADIVKPVSKKEAALRDAVSELMRGAGVEVVTDAEEGQRVLDAANGGMRLQAKKRALETASLSEDAERSLTVVSSADGAKVLNNLDNLTALLENSATQPKTFVGSVAKELGAQRYNSKSEYATFETKSGRVVTIRLADHNATVSNFDQRGELDGISIVISPKPNQGIINDGNAHIVEYYYDAIKLRRADGKPLADIVRSIKQALYNGEFKDATGIAEVQEVNIPNVRVKLNKRSSTEAERIEKETQLDIINKTNPAPDDYHTWVRTTDDILTLQEAVDEVLREDPSYELSSYPDVSDDVIRDALKTGKITVYSSYPIANGVFVTPSMMQAADYAGGMKVYSKVVSISDVAWLSTDEGQYATTKEDAGSEENEIRFFRTADGHAYGFTVGGKIFIDPRIAGADTPIHEYTHLWAEALRNANPKEWENIVRLMKGTGLWEEVKKKYPELTTDSEIADEVLAHYSGKRGAERLRQAQDDALKNGNVILEKAAAIAAINKVREALKRFWKGVADFFGVHFNSAEEVADKVLSDMLNGVKPEATGKTDAALAKEEADIIAKAKADGTYLKAPNGKPTNLTPRQWVQVRTKAFKKWFGDWEKRARIEKLRKSESVSITGEDYGNSYTDRASAKEWAKSNIKGEYKNADTGEMIKISNVGIKEVTSHGTTDAAHMQSIAAIPEMIKRAVFIEERENRKGNGKFDSYRYYVVGLNIGGVDYTAKLVVGVKNGSRFYDHRLSKIEKGTLIDSLNGLSNTVAENQSSSVSDGKGMTLTGLLQTNSSKVVDENGEPKVVLHGTPNTFTAFDKSKIGSSNDPGWLGSGFYFYGNNEDYARSYSRGGNLMEVFLNIRDPYYASYSEMERLAEENSREASDEFREMIEDEGCDGVYYNADLNEEWVAFDPTQIKSATDNVGTFDGSNTDIRYQFVGENSAGSNAETDIPGATEELARDGRGAYTDDKVSMENDPWSKMAGYNIRSKKERMAFAERERRRMVDTITDMAKRFGIADDVEIVTDLSGLEGRQRRAKGIYRKSTGKITIYIPNHVNVADAVATFLHEAVAHKGLRNLFGEHFDEFLDKVYDNVDGNIRDAIDALAKKKGLSTRTATEEYLAGLAESTDFEHLPYDGWWQRVKEFFIDMLHKVGIKALDMTTLTDNELRYILWRSYRYMTGKDKGIIAFVEDTAMKTKMGVGYSEQESVGSAAEEAGDGTDVVSQTIYGLVKKHGLMGASITQVIDSRETLEVLRGILDGRLFSIIEKRYNDEHTFGVYIPGTNLTFIFSEKFNHDEDVAEIVWWHEQAHHFNSSLSQEEVDMYGNECMRFLERNYPKLYKAIKNEYPEREWTDEACAYVISTIVERYGTDYFMIDTVSGNRKIATFANKLKSYLKNEKRKTEGWGDRFRQLDSMGEQNPVFYRQGNSRGGVAGNTGEKVRKDGKVVRIDGKAKAQDLIDSLRTNPAESERIGLNLNDVANIVENFENPKIEGENSEEELYRDGETEDAEGTDNADEEDGGKKKSDTKALRNILMFGNLSLTERTTAAKLLYSNIQNWDKKRKADAVKAIGENIADLAKAMRLQREFDKATVKRVHDLARVLMESGYLSGMTEQEVKRLLAAVKNSVGKNDIAASVQKVMDIMIDNMLRRGKAALSAIESVRGSKTDARGVEVQGMLGVDGQAIVKAFKGAKKIVNPCAGKTEDENRENTAWGAAFENVYSRMDSKDQSVADEAALEYAGMQMAQQWYDDIAKSELEESEIRLELKEEHDKKSAEERRTDSYREFAASMEEAIRQNKIERAQAYFNLAGRLSDSLRGSVENALAFKEAEKQRIGEIHHAANSDMQGRSAKEHQMPSGTRKALNNLLGNYLFTPLATYMEMLRLFGAKSVNGEGYLFNRFGRGWIDARQKEIRGVRGKLELLDAKAKEVFGGKVKTWGDLIRAVGKLPKGKVSFFNGGEMQEMELGQGNLMYIYMVNKMLDGKMKLRKMGISEEDVAQIEAAIDPRLKEIADWLQEEFLVNSRNEYNETHKRMFGASMAAVENYFPLRILNNALDVKADELDRPAVTDGISTITGSIIKRRRNSKPLDILNADALHVILGHVSQMEHWNAYAEFNRDLNTLRSYRHFRNQVQNMETIYGNGKNLWNKFNDVCQMAAGVYKPKGDEAEKAALAVAQGVTAAAVSFRLYTALKQFASIPAYIPYVRAYYMAKAMMRPDKSWEWCMENLPIFEERWKSRVSGDPRLVKSFLTAADWRRNLAANCARAGMAPNAFVDALTCSMGAYAVYNTRKRQYLKDGYSEEQAERKAIQDAEMVYNETQQSGEDAFTSTMQRDRTWWKSLFTIFRNASMSYQRQLHGALRDLGNVMSGGVDERVAFVTKQLLREKGIQPNENGEWSEADYKREEAIAKRKVRRQFVKDGLSVATFGYIMQLAWNISGYLPYLLFGDDDETKDEFWDDIWTHTFGGWLEGFTGGDVMSLAIGMLLNGEYDSWKLKKEMPITTSTYDAIGHLLKGDFGAFVSNSTNLLMQMSTGVNPQSLTDGTLAIMDACGDDPALANEATICISRMLSVPQSQIDNLYFDEVGLRGDEVSKYTPAQLAERYALYKVKRGRFFAPWTWSDEELIGKQEDKAGKAIRERLGHLSKKYTIVAYERYGETVKEMGNLVKKANAAADYDYAESARLWTEIHKDEETYEDYVLFNDAENALDDLAKLYLHAKTPEDALFYGKCIIEVREKAVRALGTRDKSLRKKIEDEMWQVSAAAFDRESGE